MIKGKTMEERKQNIIAMLMKVYNEERIKMIETFLKLTLKKSCRKRTDTYPYQSFFKDKGYSPPTTLYVISSKRVHCSSVI